MIYRYFLMVTAMTMTALPALAQTSVEQPAAPAAVPVPILAIQHVTLTTTMGAIVIALEVERAPVSAANFLRYVDAHRFDGIGFYRALDLGRGYGLIQAGTKGLPAISFPPIAHEPTSQTGLSHVDGAISWARLTPGSARGDFFIIIGNLASLDAQDPALGGDPDGFAVFGRVVRGMDVVRAIMTLPTDPNAGEGVMRGQMIAAPPRIEHAARSDPPAPEPPAPEPEPMPPPGHGG